MAECSRLRMYQWIQAKTAAQGLSNSVIAARLFVSRATVASHVTHILTKLGYTSRTQIAAWVAQQETPADEPTFQPPESSTWMMHRPAGSARLDPALCAESVVARGRLPP